MLPSELRPNMITRTGRVRIDRGLKGGGEGPVGPSRRVAKAGLLGWARGGTVNSGYSGCRPDLRTAWERLLEIAILFNIV